MRSLVPGTARCIPLLALLEVIAAPRLEILTLLMWKKDDQLDWSGALQGTLACPAVEARGREICSDWWLTAVGDAGTAKIVADR